MTPLHVLVVHSSAELYGADRSLLDFVRLRPRELTLTVVLPEPGPLQAALVDAGAQVLVGEVCKVQRGMLSPVGLLRTLRAAGRSLAFLGRLHRAHPFNVVYSNSVAVLGGALLARRFSVPHVWHVREIIAGSPRLSWAFRKLVRWGAVRVICNSDSTRSWIADGGEQCADRYRTVWNGYELATEPVDRAAARQALGAADGELLIVLVGRINAWKGQFLLVEAFAELVRSGAGPVRLAIVGSAFAGQEHFEVQLRDAVAASGCAKRIGLYPFRPDVETVWAAADVAVVPSIDPEPFGRVAVEAMAFGTPVVAAAHGGLVEIVDDGVTGLLVPPRDRAALTAALSQLAGDGDLRAAMGCAGNQRQRDFFSLQAYVNRVTALLTEAAKGRA